MTRRISVFMYGSFMDSELLRSRGADPLLHGRGNVAGRALRIGQRATLMPDPGAVVSGLVFDLTDEDIEQLYAEPSLRAYRPEPVVVDMEDRSRIPALAFTLPVPPRPEERNEEYVQRLRALALRLGFPASYVERM